MKVMVIGADGFVGSNVYRELKSDSSLDVVAVGRSNEMDFLVDLLNRESIHAVLEQSNPDVVVNCAGVVANNESANMNVEFCKNIFEEIIARPMPYPKVIITGSAAEYGVVENDGPIGEDDSLNGSNMYALSKIQEVKTAQSYAEKHEINLVVARLFNPIGPGMGDKFLISSLLRQINDIKNGVADSISVSRLDSKRDYVDIRDIARAFHSIVASPGDGSTIVNIGSGRATTNGELVDRLVRLVELNKKPTIIEAQSEPEPNYASCADIARIKVNYDWEPSYELSKTMEDIVNG